MATEKRLIDANALIKDWNELTKRMVRDADGRIPVDFGLVIRELSKTPTVDAVEVVRCKDCYHNEQCICVCCEDGEMIKCGLYHKHMDANGYCHEGRRC